MILQWKVDNNGMHNLRLNDYWKKYDSGCCLTPSDKLIMASENIFRWDDGEIRISIRPTDMHQHDGFH